MSFLNPVNEPVKRFKSTDTGAPQINYNVRTAGDVKAVLKACLVTGYGSVASAGWTAANEVGNVIEFVSPSAAMSDYRLGIDDTSASSTTWYYQYQNARVNPTSNAPQKSFTAINKSGVDNGWQLVVANSGLLLIEVVELTANSKLATRVTYWGALKSAVNVLGGANIAYWSVGADAPTGTPSSFFLNTHTKANYKIGSLSGLRMTAANFTAITSTDAKNPSNIELNSSIFIESAGGDLTAQQPAVLLRTSVNNDRLFGLFDSVTDDGRHILSVCVAYTVSSLPTLINYAAHLSIYTDFWEY